MSFDRMCLLEVVGWNVIVGLIAATALEHLEIWMGDFMEDERC